MQNWSASSQDYLDSDPSIQLVERQLASLCHSDQREFFGKDSGQLTDARVSKGLREIWPCQDYFSSMRNFQLVVRQSPGQVISPDMAKIYGLELDELDLGQLLDGLESRAESWEKSAEYFRSEKMPDGEFFIIEECSDLDEAEEIASYYRSIISKIRKQMEEQL
jgi:hypothetical protein